MNSTLYEERAKYDNIVKLIAVLANGIMIYLLYISRKESTYAFLTVLAAFFVLILAQIIFFSMKFRITNKYVEAIFGFYKHKIPFNDIENIEISDVPRLMGYGLRLRNNTIAFVSKKGKAVVIKKKKGRFKNVYLTVKDPEKFVEILKNFKKYPKYSV